MREVPIRAAMRVTTGAPSLMPLEICGLRYDAGGVALLDGIDLTLQASGITIIMGPNGAGKSLLLRLMHGLITPAAGRILCGGASLSPEVRARQAMVFQKPVLLRRSVAANVDFVLRARGRRDPERREALLDHVGLAGRANQPARLLSGGEQQRLSLARALATRPEILFLDEPTASLDPGSVLKIEQIVRNTQGAGTKVVFVTHDPGQARRLAGDVVFLVRGRVVEHAPAPLFFDAPSSAAARDFLAGRIVL